MASKLGMTATGARPGVCTGASVSVHMHLSTGWFPRASISRELGGNFIVSYDLLCSMEITYCYFHCSHRPAQTQDERTETSLCEACTHCENSMWDGRCGHLGKYN